MRDKWRAFVVALGALALTACLPKDESAVRACASQGLQPCYDGLLSVARNGTAQDVYRFYIFNALYSPQQLSTPWGTDQKLYSLLNCAATAAYEPATEEAESKIEYAAKTAATPPEITRKAADCLRRKKNSWFGSDDRWRQCAAYKVLQACPAEFRKAAK